MPPKNNFDKKQPRPSQAKPNANEGTSRKNNAIKNKNVIPPLQQTNNVGDIPPSPLPPATAAEHVQQNLIEPPLMIVQQVQNIKQPKVFPLTSEAFVWENDKDFIDAWRDVPLSSDCHYAVGDGHEQESKKNRSLLQQTNPCIPSRNSNNKSSEGNDDDDDCFIIDYFVPSVPDGRDFITDSMFSTHVDKNHQDNFRSIEDLLARIPSENPLSALASYFHSNNNNNNNTFADILKFIHQTQNNNSNDETDFLIELRRKVDLVQKLAALCKQSMLSRDWIRTNYTEIFMQRFRRFIAMQMIKNGRRGILLIKDNFDGATPEDPIEKKSTDDADTDKDDENNNDNHHNDVRNEEGKNENEQLLSEYGKAVYRYYSPEALSSTEHTVVFSVNPKMTPNLELFADMKSKNNNIHRNIHAEMFSPMISAETISKAMAAASPFFEIELESLVGIQTLAHFLEFNKEELEMNILTLLSLFVPSSEQRHRTQNTNKISEATLSIVRDKIYLLLVNYIVHLQLQNVIFSHKYKKTEQCMRQWKENIFNQSGLPFNSASAVSSFSSASKFPPRFSTKMKIQFRLVSSREILAPLMIRFNSEKEMMMDEKIKNLKKEYEDLKNKRTERKRLEKEEWEKLHPKKMKFNKIIPNKNRNINNNTRLVNARLKVTITSIKNNNRTVGADKTKNQQQNPVSVDAAIVANSKINAPKDKNIKFPRNNNTNKNVAAVVAAASEPSTKSAEPQTNVNNNKTSNNNNNSTKNNKPFFDNGDYKIHVVKKFNSDNDDDDDDEDENLLIPPRHKNKKNPSTLLTHGKNAMENIFLYMLSRIPPSGVRRAATANLDDDENED